MIVYHISSTQYKIIPPPISSTQYNIPQRWGSPSWDSPKSKIKVWNANSGGVSSIDEWSPTTSSRSWDSSTSLHSIDEWTSSSSSSWSSGKSGKAKSSKSSSGKSGKSGSSSSSSSTSSGKSGKSGSDRPFGKTTKRRGRGKLTSHVYYLHLISAL